MEIEKTIGGYVLRATQRELENLITMITAVSSNTAARRMEIMGDLTVVCTDWHGKEVL